MKAPLLFICILVAGCASAPDRRLGYIAAECSAEKELSADERRSCFLKAQEDYDAVRTRDSLSFSPNGAGAHRF